MTNLVRSIPWTGATLEGDSDPHLRQEWLVTNGLGGYASGTVAGVSTRRYHGLLIAALPSPLGRLMMLADLNEEVRLPDRRICAIGTQERIGGSRKVDGLAALREFRMEMGLPVWTYEASGFTIERRLLMPHRQNTVHIRYRLLAGEGTLRLGLRPALHFRAHDAPVSLAIAGPYSVHVCEDRYELTVPGDLPRLRILVFGARAAFTAQRESYRTVYKLEQARGYDYQGELFSPGFFRVDLSQEQDATLVGSTEAWETVWALRPEDAFRAETERRTLLVGQADPEARSGLPAELVLAADQFIVTPSGRIEDAARARAAGDEVRTIIAGYHWFTDWGRDTMISLEGLTLATGRQMEAAWIPANLRVLHPRRPATQHVSGGREGGPVPHRRRDPVVLPRHPPLRRAHQRPGHVATAAAQTDRHCRAPPARDAVRNPRGSQGRPAVPGGAGLPTHLDGRQSRGLGGDAAARQAGGNQRPVVQRSVPARPLGGGGVWPGARPRPAGARRAGARVLQPTLLVRRGRLSLRCGGRRTGRRQRAAP